MQEKNTLRGRVRVLTAAAAFAFLCVWTGAGTAGTIYEYVDEDGVITLTDKPPAGKRYKYKAVESFKTPSQAEREAEAQEELRGEERSKATGTKAAKEDREAASRMKEARQTSEQEKALQQKREEAAARLEAIARKISPKTARDAVARRNLREMAEQIRRGEAPIPETLPNAEENP
jgi:hypothetical protein